MSDAPQEPGAGSETPQRSDEHRQRIKHTIEKAEKYQKRKEGKHQAEMALIHRALPLLKEVRTILDAPCGVGRATVMLAKEGYEVTGIDLGEGALELARKAVAAANVKAVIEKQDLVKLDYADDQFDAVLCFRLIHHLPTPQHREEIIAELCRVAKRYVLISYLSPLSLTSVKRKLKTRLGIRQTVQHVTPLAELQGYCKQQGYRLSKDLAQSLLVHSLHLALFERNTV
jgi:2-polyprenyl-3-methyl-5-hydroxy-6-metoxy-1,4-benzoquinol methylase